MQLNGNLLDFNALASELHDSVAYVDSAYEMWGELQERFS